MTPHDTSDDPARKIIEPSANLRQAATTAREWFVALIGAGFTEAQACQILGSQIAGYGGSGEQ